MHQQPLAFRRQPHIARVAVQQLPPEHLFQLADLPRYRRLRPPDPPARAGKTARLGQHHKGPQQAGIHVMHRHTYQPNE
jgi:hypothetical protein